MYNNIAQDYTHNTLCMASMQIKMLVYTYNYIKSRITACTHMLLQLVLESIILVIIMFDLNCMADQYFDSLFGGIQRKPIYNYQLCGHLAQSS